MVLVTAALMLVPRFWVGLTRISLRLAATYAGLGVVVAMHWLTFYGAIKLSNASVAATCIALAPLLVAFVEPALAGGQFEMRQALFGLVVIPGVALVVGGVPAEMRLGILAGIVSAVLVAVFGTLNKRYILHSDALTITGLEMTAGALCLTVLLPFLERPQAFAFPGRQDAVLLFILATVCTLLPFALSLVALRHLSAFTTALATNMEPIYAIFLAIIFFGEQRQLDAMFYCGVAIILTAVFGHSALSWKR
jgi:drug/metabolite transporter (DMT)-like permease